MCSSVSCTNEFESANFIPFSCVFTWQGKIKKDEGTKWWWSSGATKTDDLYRFSYYSYCSASSKSHLPYSTTSGACSNMAVWYLVACCIWCLACIAPNLLNCISLAYILYMWIWHAFRFLVHTTSAYHTMFLHETTLLVYSASVTYDGTPLSWQCDIGLRLEYDF